MLYEDQWEEAYLIICLAIYFGERYEIIQVNFKV